MICSGLVLYPSHRLPIVKHLRSRIAKLSFIRAPNGSMVEDVADLCCVLHGTQVTTPWFVPERGIEAPMCLVAFSRTPGSVCPFTPCVHYGLSSRIVVRTGPNEIARRAGSWILCWNLGAGSRPWAQSQGKSPAAHSIAYEQSSICKSQHMPFGSSCPRPLPESASRGSFLGLVGLSGSILFPSLDFPGVKWPSPSFPILSMTHLRPRSNGVHNPCFQFCRPHLCFPWLS